MDGREENSLTRSTSPSPAHNPQDTVLAIAKDEGGGEDTPPAPGQQMGGKEKGGSWAGGHRQKAQSRVKDRHGLLWSTDAKASDCGTPGRHLALRTHALSPPGKQTMAPVCSLWRYAQGGTSVLLSHAPQKARGGWGEEATPHTGRTPTRTRRGHIFSAHASKYWEALLPPPPPPLPSPACLSSLECWEGECGARMDWSAAEGTGLDWSDFGGCRKEGGEGKEVSPEKNVWGFGGGGWVRTFAYAWDRNTCHPKK